MRQIWGISKGHIALEHNFTRHMSWRIYRKYNDEQKVNIRNVVKLEPQVFWYKAYGRVLRCSYFIPRVMGFRMPFFIPGVWWEGYVKEYPPTCIQPITLIFGTTVFAFKAIAFHARRVSLLFIGTGSFVKAVKQRLSFLVSFRAFRSVGCPSNPFYGTRDLTALLVRLYGHCKRGAVTGLVEGCLGF